MPETVRASLDRLGLHKHWLFIALLGITAALRFVILFVSQTHVNSDEAILGLMAKHIVEGRYHPFYQYGAPYNASFAWEAYVAAIPMAIFGFGVVALKSSTVVLSLVCLAVFYVMANRLLDVRFATLAAFVLAFSPSLLKWHFQQRGYAFYFIEIPLLVLLFLILDSRKPISSAGALLFGIVSGICVWTLELIVPILAALWLLLLFRRKLSVSRFAIGTVGYIIGYAPVIWWNFTHSFANWHFLFIEKPEIDGLTARFGLFAWRSIFLHELPKFFSADTVLWYYPDSSWIGYLLYAVAISAVGVALLGALRWGVIRGAFRDGFGTSDAAKDLLMLILIAASFIPYVVAPLRVPSYFLAGYFFISILIARLLQRCFASPTLVGKVSGLAVLMAVTVTGTAAMVQTASHDEIETLTLCGQHEHCMTRIPGADIDAVKRDLDQHNITEIWTSISFTYPLIFETNGKLIASESIFGVDRPVYPPEIPKPEPSGRRGVFVIETDSPYRAEIEAECEKKGGVPPRVTEHGKLVVIEQRFAGELN